jgi:hypothetical protein
MACFLNNTDTPDIYDITGHGRFSMHPDFLKLFITGTYSTESKSCFEYDFNHILHTWFRDGCFNGKGPKLFKKCKSEGVT